ncbi:hypothetical protein P7C70_g3656, partial [Phenoliferia sp. Uapishka_3]
MSSRRSARPRLSSVDVKPKIEEFDVKPKMEMDDDGDSRRRQLRSQGPPVTIKAEVIIADPVAPEEKPVVEVPLPVVALQQVAPTPAASRISLEFGWPARRIVGRMQGYWLIDWEDSVVTSAEFDYWRTRVMCKEEPDAANNGGIPVKWWPSWELKSGTHPSLVAAWSARVVVV